MPDSEDKETPAKEEESVHEGRDSDDEEEDVVGDGDEGDGNGEDAEDNEEPDDEGEEEEDEEERKGETVALQIEEECRSAAIEEEEEEVVAAVVRDEEEEEEESGVTAVAADGGEKPQQLILTKLEGEIVAIEAHEVEAKHIVGKVVGGGGKRGSKVSMLEPLDKKLPKMFIYDFALNEEEQQRTNWNEVYVVARYIDWPCEYLYPGARVTGILGHIGDIEIECRALLTVKRKFLSTSHLVTETYLRHTATSSNTTFTLKTSARSATKSWTTLSRRT